MCEFVLVFPWVIGAEMDLGRGHGGTEFFLGSAEDTILFIEFQDMVVNRKWFYA
jgi:hypothetical protein